jgi:uncharacterized protein
VILRSGCLSSLHAALGRSRAVVLVGPRQSGKTTLARELLDEDSVNYFDLEDPASLARLEQPKVALEPLKGLVVIDEVQLRPELFPLLRVLLDRKNSPAKFLVLGSASGELLRQASQSLAGRMERIELSGFGLNEVAADDVNQLWLQGGLPPSFLTGDPKDSFRWRKAYVGALLERDFPNWGVRIPATTLRRFWSMLAHYHGQIWNASEVARSLDATVKTTCRYLDLLTDAFMVRQLQPYHANIGKRQVKAPKVYLRDSGLLHQLLGIQNEKELLLHPKVGASWEGFVLEQVLSSIDHDEAFYWATYQGAEMDLVLSKGTRLFGIEFKRTDAPKMTKSIGIAMEDLGLESVSVIYPGSKEYPLADGVSAVPLAQLANGIRLP